MFIHINKLNPFESNYSLSSPEFDNYGITHSLMDTFFTCRRKFFYKICGLAPVARNKNVFFGSEMHELLDLYYQGALNLSTASLTRVLMERNPEATPESIGRIIGVMQAYGEVYKDKDSNILVNFTERSMERKLLGVRLRGKIDGDVEFRDKSFALEHKTKSRYSPVQDESYETFLNIDQQTGIYMYLSGRDNVMYNLIKNPSQKRVKKTENVVQFTQRIKEEAIAKPKENFHRIRLYIPEQTKQLKLNEVKKKIKIIKRACNIKKFTCVEDSPHFFRQSESCSVFGFCPYLSVCATGKAGLDRFSLNNPVHGELK